MSSFSAIAIDIGGTHLRLAVISSSGKISFLRKKSVFQKSPSLFLKNLKDEILNLQKECGSKIDFISVGVPGLVNFKEGIVFSSPHYPQWKNWKLKKALESAVGLPVKMDNDCNMIARGEMSRGAARKWDSFLMVTLGTGIGGALVYERQLVHGNRGFAGEVGHICVDPQGRRCGCGSQGCWETKVSSSALKNYLLSDKKLSQKFKTVDDSLIGRFAFIEAKKGNAKIKNIFKEMGFYLGVGLASCIHATGLDHIVLGGGLVSTMSLMETEMQKALKKYLYPEIFKKVVIVKSKLLDKAGLMGAMNF